MKDVDWNFIALLAFMAVVFLVPMLAGCTNVTIVHNGDLTVSRDALLGAAEGVKMSCDLAAIEPGNALPEGC